MIKEFEKLLQNIQFSISNWTFKIEENEELLWKIIKIYELSKVKDFESIKDILKDILKDIVLTDFDSNDISSNKTRDWEIPVEEDNIEAYNSIEVVSWIFLQNLKDELWKK